MKKLTNQVTDIDEKEDSDDKLSFSDLIRLVLNGTTASKGCTVSDMRVRMKILDKCEEKPDVLEFEDTEFDVVHGLVKEFKFAMINEGIIIFADALDVAKEDEKKDKKKGEEKVLEKVAGE